jgi:hypothetical protein
MLGQTLPVNAFPLRGCDATMLVFVADSGLQKLTSEQHQAFHRNLHREQ